ncbi:MAG TPA: bifunctional hydroxymethylpyrimidine kinase/phosphomethylpyrimidine kinase [Pyrinomonadaceae bacterium]|nr:bifunctional hydroxymethylpyrimidine kinase/phosphomethylpyrimidine kinase [Pyrinomonadaceae bacterium]
MKGSAVVPKRNGMEISGPAVALTIAGLDPSGGAGVIADVRTFAAFGCFATAAITSLTFQNTTGVFGAVNQTPETVRAQVLPIVEDFKVACAKTGMLPTREIISEVARLFRETALPAPVVDPVMRATSGDDLIDDDAVESLISELFPLAVVITPNIPEAERLTGLTITNEPAMRVAAMIIRGMGARAVLIKGGHLAGIERNAIDVLDNEGLITVFADEMIAGGEVHGSGCTLSAAIAAGLGNGQDLEEAIRSAKSFVTESIRHSPRLGRGARPLYNDLRHA